MMAQWVLFMSEKDQKAKDGLFTYKVVVLAILKKVVAKEVITESQAKATQKQLVKKQVF